MTISQQQSLRLINMAGRMDRSALRVCLLSWGFSPQVGGAEVVAAKHARQLQAFGQRAVVVTLRIDRQWKGQDLCDGVPVNRVGGIYRRNGLLRAGRVGYLPCAIGVLLTLWRMRHHFDVIHAIQESTLVPAAMMVGRVAHKPIVISIQTAGPSEPQRAQFEHAPALMGDTLGTPDFLKLDRKNTVASNGSLTDLPRTVVGGQLIVDWMRKSEAVIHINSSRLHSYLTSLGFQPTRFVRIPHGVDTGKFRPAPERRPNPHRRERIVTCVARLAYAKGVDVLLHAWGRMMRMPAEWRANLNLTLCLVGDGPDRDRLERITAELGIQDSVQFLGMRKDVVDLLHQSWAYVQPSRWESLPNALLEAMACGLSCVATQVSGSEDVIRDGVNGLLVEPEQPAEMAEALKRVLMDADLAQRMGQEARETIVQGYDLAHVTQQFIDLYHSLVGTAKATGHAWTHARRTLGEVER